MKSKTVLLLSACLVGLLSTVAASNNYDVIVVENAGATKVEKAVSLENICSTYKLQDLSHADAVVVLVAELPRIVEVCTLSPVKVFVPTPESFAYRIRSPQLAENYILCGHKPPANVNRSTKIFLKNCSIRQC